ncbi:MerR family transcriptional regulator [Actinosynnema sp. CA-299493]
MNPETNEPRLAADNLDDDHYPAFTMGRAAEMLGTTPGFLRGLDEAKLIEPERSSGGHRRYSRYQLRLASRVRELVDQGMSLDAACRIVTLEDQLQEARDLNKQNEPDQPYPPLRGV